MIAIMNQRVDRMGFRIIFKLGSALFLSASAFQSAFANPESPDAEVISRLIEQLGARRFADREAAADLHDGEWEARTL